MILSISGPLPVTQFLVISSFALNMVHDLNPKKPEETALADDIEPAEVARAGHFNWQRAQVDRHSQKESLIETSSMGTLCVMTSKGHLSLLMCSDLVHSNRASNSCEVASSFGERQ